MPMALSIASIAVATLPPYFVRKQWGDVPWFENAMGIVGIVLIGILVVTVSRSLTRGLILMRWRCPACGECFGWDASSRWPLVDECVHCELPRDATLAEVIEKQKKRIKKR
ncbi:MAG TPA: hypothetical protein VL096_00740 [Pirellulaceae bacterium]|nr:hypothetical protein [Pirellulaceae bacterium]